MAILDDDMKRVVKEQRLGFVATVCPDGTPNLSPKGTTAVWDDDHLFFVDIRARGAPNPMRAVVLMTVERALPITSPAYDAGMSEDELREHYRRYW